MVTRNLPMFLLDLKPVPFPASLIQPGVSSSGGRLHAVTSHQILKLFLAMQTPVGLSYRVDVHDFHNSLVVKEMHILGVFHLLESTLQKSKINKPLLPESLHFPRLVFLLGKHHFLVAREQSQCTAMDQERGCTFSSSIRELDSLYQNERTREYFCIPLAGFKCASLFSFRAIRLALESNELNVSENNNLVFQIPPLPAN